MTERCADGGPHSRVCARLNDRNAEQIYILIPHFALGDCNLLVSPVLRWLAQSLTRAKTELYGGQTISLYTDDFVALARSTNSK